MSHNTGIKNDTLRKQRTNEMLFQMNLGYMKTYKIHEMYIKCTVQTP